MKKALIVGGAAVGVGLFATRCASKCGGVNVERMIERMPDSAPPKWMFHNISAIRANTDRILALLDAERAPATGEPEPTAV